MCMSLLLAGCKIGEISVGAVADDKEVFRIGEISCSLKEAKVYLANYQNIYGYAFGLDLWQHDFGIYSLEEYVKNVTMKELTRIICMAQLAKKQEMELTEEEKRKIADAAAAYFNSLTEDERTYMGVSQNDVCTYYERYALAQKFYGSLIGSINGEVSDDEARIMEIMQIFVSDGQKAAAVEEKIAAGEDFAGVANNYNELSAIQVTISRDDVADEVEEVAFRLDNNEISNKIEADGGYYFIKCLNKYNRELTEANKENIVEKREKEAFDDAYNGFVSTLSSNLNQELWDSLEVDMESGLHTNSFFDTFENYFGEV